MFEISQPKTLQNTIYRKIIHSSFTSKSLVTEKFPFQNVQKPQISKFHQRNQIANEIAEKGYVTFFIVTFFILKSRYVVVE